MNSRRFLFLFAALFLLRLTFGLCEAKWWEKDELQTYLIGLKCYTTGTWPYFGPDVNGAENQSFNSQIPGALEGLVIGLPFYVLPIPEAPFIFLSLMSTAGAALLAWYIRRKVPNLSFPWLFVWISITPWSLYEGTHVINPAFNFLPSVLFFIGFMESLPFFTANRLSPFWSNALMGFSLFWVMQFHFSYIYFLPVAAFSLLFQLIHNRNIKGFIYFAAGAAPMLALIIPTFLKYGIIRTNVASGFVVPFNWYNVQEWVTILARYFSLVCFELPRFLGEDTRHRIGFLTGHPLLAVPGALLWVIGLLQPLALLFFWFKKPNPLPQWTDTPGFRLGFYVLVWVGIGLAAGLPLYQAGIPAIFLWFIPKWKLLNPFFAWFQKPHPLPGWEDLKLFIFLAYLMVWGSFWFTSKLPLAHIYLVFYPFLMLYSCYGWSLFAGNPRWRLAAKVFLVVGIYFQLGFALVVARKDSLYIRRDSVAQAIKMKNYHLAGERRPQSLY